MSGNRSYIRNELQVRMSKAGLGLRFEGVVCPRSVRPVPGGMWSAV